jgi:hypothetical protein
MEAPAAEEAAAIKEAAVAWRSRPRWAAVGGGVEEPATPGRGGARGGGGLEEKATPGCSWTRAVGRGGWVSAGIG